jgi:hypothetical protein
MKHSERASHVPQIGLSLDITCVRGLDPPPEPLVQFGIVVESQPIAKEPDLFLALEEVLALLLDQDPAATTHPGNLAVECGLVYLSLAPIHHHEIAQ